MRPRLSALVLLLAQGLFSLACLATAAYAFAYLYLTARGGDPFAARFAVSGLDVPAHFFGAGLALLLLPLQLSQGVRRRWPALHRLGGWLSAGAILIGGVSGLSLAQQAHGGWPSRAGFSLLSLLWLGVTANGIRLAIAGQIARHRRWMAYSMALTAGAVTLRVMLALGTGPLGWPFLPVYIGTAWASWLFNLAVCAWLLRLRAPAPPTASRAVPGTRWASGPPAA
ncbi:DUF2306 domain-containing protein [Luteimonas sp. SDU82]|uniref:DUF2306 domain-containing protein n=1 Tax=Luteimonas sp. SDU82 TaxID=3422592 RepID=UPI003EBF7F23